MTDVFELRLQRIVVRFDHEWQLMANVLHGAFLTHRDAGFALHLRDWSRSGDAEWLRAELRAQNGGATPTDLSERVVSDRSIIGGTFRHALVKSLVREWFISDGRHGANACVLFPEATPRAMLDPYERMIDSVVFAET